MKRYVLFFAGFFVLCLAPAQYPGQFASKIRVPLAKKTMAEAFNLSDVRLLDSPFKEAMERDQTWLLSLDNNRLLHNYRVNAGLKTTAKAYGGWEELDCELRGHSLGHILSALAMMYASTGDTVYRNKGAALVAGLAECQEALGSSGYLAAFPEYFIKRVIDGTGVWAPWYTLHKIYAGLLDMYLICDNVQAFEVVQKMADWAYNKLAPLSDEQIQKMLRTEFGGMSEVMYNLYSVTGNGKYRLLAEKFYHHAVLDPLAEGKDNLAGLHANTQIPKIIGEARGYEITGNEKEREIAKFFWETVLKNHTYAIGGNSDGEYFGPPGKLSDRLSSNTTETCNTYNMLKLTRHLFCWEADVKYADYYERALYNHILASQNQEDGNVCYYVSLRPGDKKMYSDKFNSFWCCVGTGFENHAKYGEGIYYKSSDGGLIVNLFIPSELNWKENNLTLRQENRYPDEPSTTLTVGLTNPLSLPIYLRYPSWAVRIHITVNGRVLPVREKPGSYIRILRQWKNGDIIRVEFGMDLHMEPMPDNPSRAAILYGPVVLAGVFGPVRPDPINIPVLITEGKPVSQWLVPVEGKPLAFETSGVGRPSDCELMPFFKVYGQQHYTVYWDFVTAKDWEDKKREYELMKREEEEIARRTVDYVKTGDSRSEVDHNFEGINTYDGEFGDKVYRDARDGGWFRYDMAVDETSQLELWCTYWGNDSGRKFEIWIDSVKIADEMLTGQSPNRFYNKTYPIPVEAVKGKKKVCVTFRAYPNSMAGGVFGCRILRKADSH